MGLQSKPQSKLKLGLGMEGGPENQALAVGVLPPPSKDTIAH